MDQEHEEFEINETDFEYAMNPGARPSRRQTKEQTVYGIWANSDDEDDRPSFSKNSGKRGDYTAPVAFVSGGIKKGNKIENADGVEEEEYFNQTTSSAPPKRAREVFSGGFSKEAGSQVFAGMRTSQFQGAGETSAAWAKTSGKGNVIMQMMQKMGYVHGKGLGANQQGIVEPVQAKLRVGRGAIGAYGKEAQGPKFGESAADAQSRISGGGEFAGGEGTRPREKQENWKKSKMATNRKIQYKTLEEVVDNGAQNRFEQKGFGQGLGVKIIDMTGPEQKVYNDFSSFSNRTRAPDQDSDRTKFNVPELSYNLNALMDMTEQEIVRNDRELRFLKDQTLVLREDENKLREQVEDSKIEVDRMQEVMAVIQRFEKTSSQKAPTLTECRDLFLLLRKKYAVEYKLFGLDSLAITNVLPLIKAQFSSWDPLDPDQQERGLEVLQEWKEVLGESKSSAVFSHFRKETNALSAFDTCVWESWMPNVRRAALTWSPCHNGPSMLNLIAIWLPFLPQWIGENLLEQVIIPRIKDQVDLWDPVTDNIPIDSWLLPWQPVLGDRLLLVYPIIRQKLGKGLKNWIPGDRSAIESIRPWKDVFASGTMHTFLGFNIVPKLERALQTIDVNTTEQFNYLELFKWTELINVDVICQMMTRHFFPRFYANLCSQLNLPNVSLAAVQEYYKDWKNMLPVNFLAMKPVRDELTRALMAINQVQKGLVLTPMTAPPNFAQPMRPHGNFIAPPTPTQFFRR
uniref:G-patch domain-containing protein n=1 Tax=Ditylenchus dipsaci TaxID=166011 RepID=A0A915E515_9BILA